MPRMTTASSSLRAVSLFITALATACHSETTAPQPTVALEQALTGNVDTLTFSPQADAAIRGSAANTNFGSATSLDINRSVIAVDAAAIKASVGPHDVVVSAQLELSLVRSALRRTVNNVQAYRLTEAWTEASVTWNCAIDADPPDNQRDCSAGTQWSMDAAPNPWATPATAQATIPAAPTGKVTLDLTSDVQRFVSGQDRHYGWLLRGTGTGERDEFAARESSTPPRLTVNVRRCDPAQCDDGNACTIDSCDATAQCAHAPAAEGGSCSDGNACTEHDMCHSGSCQPGASIACVASDSCHIAGSCDPQTGACSQPTVPDATACSDGDACTQQDQCVAGVCTGGSAVACAASDQCHGAGTCDATTGLCSNPALADATACNDGDSCTQHDICLAGACHGNPQVCSAADQCHTAGVCDGASGSCSNPAIAGCRILRGVVAGSYFTAANGSTRASSAPSTYSGVKVCIDENADLVCNEQENSTTSAADGTFELDGAEQGQLVAEIATTAQNAGHPVSQRLVLRAVADQVAQERRGQLRVATRALLRRGQPTVDRSGAHDDPMNPASSRRPRATSRLDLASLTLMCWQIRRL